MLLERIGGFTAGVIVGLAFGCAFIFTAIRKRFWLMPKQTKRWKPW